MSGCGGAALSGCTPPRSARRTAALLIAGASGRGKSNVALACLNSELLYAADDFCVVSRAPDWTVHSLHCTGRIVGGDLARHPHLRNAVSNPDRLDREKALFFLNQGFAERLIREMPLRAIVLPRVMARGASEIVPIPAAAAQKTIALGAIELAQWTGRDTLLKVAELLRELPCYELQVGASISEVPAALAAPPHGASGEAPAVRALTMRRQAFFKTASRHQVPAQ